MSSIVVCVVQVEYEEEEIQVKEVEKEVVTEISMPQVKTLFKYKGQGMGFEKGEVRESMHASNSQPLFAASNKTTTLL